MAHPFEQQPNESTKAFAAFSLYLSLGNERTLENVAKKLQKSMAIIGRWSRTWRWIERVDAYVQHMARVEQESTEAILREKSVVWGKRQQELREEEWEIHTQLVEAGRAALRRMIEKEKGATLGDIARALELASKLGRLATGMATDRTEVTGQDGGPILVEFEAALRKVYGEVIEADVVGETPALPAGT